MLEEATPEDREQRQNHSQKSQWKKKVKKEAMPDKVTEEHSQQQAEEHSPTAGEKEHSQQRARRAQPTASEKEHTQQWVRIKRTDRAVPTAGTYEEKNVSKKGFEPMKRETKILEVIDTLQQNKN